MSQLPSLGPRGEGWVVGQVLLGAALIAASARRPAWHGPLRVLTSLAGGALLAAGAWLGFAGARDLRSSISPLPRPRPDAELVEDGVYALVRHPIYGGQILLCAGLALVRASPRALALLPAFAVFVVLKAAREEVFLSERYDGYRAYATRTRRFLPGIW